MTAQDAPAPVFTVYSYGLVHASVCTSLTDEQATAHLNGSHPTGLTHGWAVSPEAFADGEPNGRPCNTYPDSHRHLLFVC